MLHLLLALLACAQDPMPQDGQGVTLETRDIRSGEEGDAMVYRIDLLRMEGPTMRLVADRAIIVFDAALYRERFGGLLDEGGEDAEGIPVFDPEAAAPQRGLMQGLWSRRVLRALGLPEDSQLLREIRLEGHVELDTVEGMRLRCDVLLDRPAEGRSRAELAIIDWPPGEGGPNGWPLRMTAASIAEEPDCTLIALDAGVTTCLDTPPHYQVHFDELRATREEDGELLWKPEGGWLELGRVPFLPVPTPDFQAGDSFLGFRGITYESSRRLGSTIYPRFGGRHEIADGQGAIDWTFMPGWSVKRGFPLELRGEMNRPGFSSTLDIFYLNDQGKDRHPLARNLARDSEERSRLRWWGRWTFDPEWRLDAELSYPSDPLVDPEFFRRVWIRDGDPATGLRLMRRRSADYFSVEAFGRIDDIDFTPIEGLGIPPGPAPRTLDLLPLASYDSFSTTKFELPVGLFGGRDGRSPVNLSWGADFGRMRLRDRDILSARAGDFLDQGDVSRTRGRVWGEVALPLSAGGVFLRPGLRLDGALWEDDSPGAEQDEQLYSEAFLDTGVSIEKRYEDGWRHRVLPQVRLRSRTANREPSGALIDFDGNDLLAEGEVIELSMRQFFFAPDKQESWLDVNVLFPYYPDGAELLESELAPFPRTQAGQGFGPAELRLNWTPGNYGDALDGVRWESRIRHDFRVAETEEIFTRLTVRPDRSFYWGLDYYEVNRTVRDFAIGSVFGGLRFTEEWALGFRQSENFDGNAGLNSAWGAQYYGHDFLFEFGYTRVQASGESGIYFNVSPRFFFDPFGSRDLARLRFQ